MSYHVLEIKTDGTIIKTVQREKPGYEQQRKAVGGFIETIPYFTKMTHEGIEYKRGTAYANEEGAILGKLENKAAMQAWRYSCPGGNPERMHLSGDVIFFARVKDTSNEK